MNDAEKAFRNTLPEKQPQNGSVLLVTLLVVSLLMVVVLTLLVSVRMGLREVTSSQQNLDAQTNARLGAELAIAQLQKHAGPDQRITAPATTVFPEKDVAAMSGEMYTLYRNRAEVFGGALGPRRTYLTDPGRAAWEQDLQTWWNQGEKHPRWTAVLDASLRADGGSPDRYGEPDRSQTPVWLVSGNETAPQYTPLSPLPADAVELVGTGSAADAAASVDGLDGRVRAPRIPVQAPGARTGSYAFWVGDESTKANFTVRDPWFEETNITSATYRNRLQVPQRVGWERLRDFAPVFDAAANNLEANDPLFERVASSSQIGLLHDGFPPRLRENFHHLTAHSRSLFTDTALGGLKKDLTVFFEGSGSSLTPSTPIPDRSRYEPGDPRFGGATNNGFPRTNDTEGLPTWGQLKDWHDNVDNARAPVLAGYQFFTAFTHRNGEIQFHILPLLTLWNPYDVPLTAGTEYQIQVRHNIGLWNLGFAVHNPGYVDPTPDATPAGYADGHMVGDYYLSPLQGIGWYDRDNASTFKQFGVDFRPGQLWHAAGNRPNFRFTPFDTSPTASSSETVPDPLSHHATWVTYTVQESFNPGEVKVFTLDQTLQVNPRDLHAGTQTIPLSNVYYPDFPDSFWFPIAEGLQKEPGVPPLASDQVRWYGERLDNNTPSTFSVRLIDGATPIWEILHTGAQHNREWFRSQYTDSWMRNHPNQPSTWNTVYHFDDWQLEPKNISDTRDRSSPVQALANNRISPFLIQNRNIFHANAFAQSGPASAYRAFASFNLMAPVMDPIPELDLARAERGENNQDGFHTLSIFQSHRGDQASNWHHDQVTDNKGYALMGWQNENTALLTGGLSHLVLRQSRTDFQLLSLGRLQQANLAAYLWQPGFAVGNSEASPYVDRATAAGLVSYPLRNATGTRHYLLDLGLRQPSTHLTFPNDDRNRFLDLSFVLNEALWDRYFLSSIPQTGPLNPAAVLPNSRHRFTADTPDDPAAVRDEQRAAAYLHNVGALNVNSTSVEAWKALFTAFRDLRIEGLEDGEQNPANTLPVSRSLAPELGPVDFHESGGTPSDYGANSTGLRRYDRMFQGFRFLTDAQIESLSERIVDEVRLRGPFYSLADFVNRRLVEPDLSGGHWRTARTANQSTGNNDVHTLPAGYDPMQGLFGLQGALQRAINLSGINGGVNHPHADDPDDRAFRIDLNPGNGIQGDPMSIYPAAAFYLDTEHLAGAPAGEAGQLMSHAPGFVTQADLLAMIGPALTARGDTFVIRSYGDSTDADGETIQARAWLEVVVQRIAEPVIPAGTSGTDRYEPADTWGRRFVIVSKKWLVPGEI